MTIPFRCHRCKVLDIECSCEQSLAADVPQQESSVRNGGISLRAVPKKNQFLVWSLLAPQIANIDWSKPMLAIRHLTETSPFTSNSEVDGRQGWSIAGGNITKHSYQLSARSPRFYAQYAPWLNFRPIRHSLVDIVCCAVATRHLEGGDGREETRFTPAADDSVEAIQALLTLATWGLFGETKKWDPQTLISTALYLGPGRTPSSRRTSHDQLFVQYPLVFNDQTDLGPVRLGLLARGFELSEEGVSRPRQANGQGVQDWLVEINGVLERMKNGKRLFMSLPVVLDEDQFYFHVLHIYQDITRLLFIYRAFWEVRSSLPDPAPGELWRERFTAHQGATWGHDVVHTSEAPLVAFIRVAPTGPSFTGVAGSAFIGADGPAEGGTRIPTAPDAFLHAIALTAGLLFCAKALVARRGEGHALPCTSDLILAETMVCLETTSCGQEHVATQCLSLGRGMAERWEAREGMEVNIPLQKPTADLGADEIQDPETVDEHQTMPLNAPSVFPALRLPTSESSTQLPQQPPFLDVELMFLDAMLADDTSFWDSLGQDHLW
ncbi:hypothetical protein C8R43DRAFT_1135577 [Mycena crocata]|nr:hypothetical protein C8R43DRAFT_1135577 [Mycena crocata]